MMLLAAMLLAAMRRAGAKRDGTEHKDEYEISGNGRQDTIGFGALSDFVASAGHGKGNAPFDAG